MATKTANVTARVAPEVKERAESVLEQLGVPVSVLIDSLYRQIIMTNGIPYTLSVRTLPTRDSMSDSQFNSMMETSISQAVSGQGCSADEAFKRAMEQI